MVFTLNKHPASPVTAITPCEEVFKDGLTHGYCQTDKGVFTLHACFRLCVSAGMCVWGGCTCLLTLVNIQAQTWVSACVLHGIDLPGLCVHERGVLCHVFEG